MQKYKKIRESLYIPNKIKLIFDSSIDSDDNKEEVYKTFFENLNLFIELSNKSLNYDQIHVIFDSFKNFIEYFPNKIKECFSPELCLNIQSFIEENLIYSKETRIIKDAMNVIACLCYFDLDFIQFFSDNDIIDQVTNVYLKNTHDLYESLIFLFDSLLIKNSSQAVSKMCNFIFSSTNNYCYALHNEERKNVRIAISFFYFLVGYPENLKEDKILRIFDVVKNHIEYNEQCPIPNDIFVFTLWTYYNLLYNYPMYMGYFIDKKIISAVGLLLENDFDDQDDQNMENDDLEIHNKYTDLEKNPQRPLLAIFRIFYTKVHIFSEELFQSILEATSLSRLIELTSSNDIKVALESFDVIKKIIIHHSDLIEDLLSFDLIPCLESALKDSFYIKEASYECVCELLQSEVPNIVFNILQNEVFLLSIEYISADSENKIKVFLNAILRALRLMEKNGWIENIVDYFSANDIFDFFEQIYEDQQIDIIREIMHILSPHSLDQ